MGGRFDDGLPLEGAHRRGQEVRVHLHAHGGDVAVLLLAEDVAGAADLQVAHRDWKPAPSSVKLLDDLQPLLGPLASASARRG